MQMTLPPLWWAYRRAARWRSSILLVTLLTFGLVSVQQREPSAPLNWNENELAFGCIGCSARNEAEPAAILPGPEVYSQLAAEFAEGSLSTHCGKLRFPSRQPLCLDSDLLPETEPCLVYSFSVNSSLSFEGEMARRGCEVHLFDATMAPLTPPQLPPNVSHHLIGIDGRTRPHRTADGRKMALMTLDEVTSVLAHQKRDIHYLKLDVKGSEWGALQQQLTSSTAALRQVSQLHVVFYLALPRGIFSGDPEWRNQLVEEDAHRFLMTLKALKVAGFRLAHIRSSGAFPDIGVAHVYETLWIRWEEV